ncbi:MAG: hypothetical protein H6813_02970 [Phycisphaeraceae bacterium]|nr:hypothetical protein [Phycisphaeraceae bacterium]MCB9848721.1 hypothetical protein [Phycisphaeraceae bacterium]
MRLRYLFTLLLALPVICGCSARSLNPVVAAGEADAIGELVGVWGEADENEWPPAEQEPEIVDSTRIEITPADSRGVHTVIITDPDEAHAGREGEFRFELSLMREDDAIVGHLAMHRESEADIPESLKEFLVRVYTPVVVEISADRRWMAATFIDSQEMKLSFESGQAPIGCVRAGDSALISAAPATIREFLRTMPERFREGPLVFRRLDGHP